MKTTISPGMLSWVTLEFFIVLVTGNSCKKEETASAFVYEAVQYTIDQPDGTMIILQSRGTGHGTNDAFFDIYIGDVQGGVTAFRYDVWYTFNAMNAAEAVNQSNDKAIVSGHIAGRDSNFFLDINGGSDMGGVTYQFKTGSFESGKSCLTKTTKIISGTPIVICIETGGNIDIGTPDQWDNIYENTNGVLFWLGSKFVTNETAAHAYFLDLRINKKLYQHLITEISADLGTQSNIPGYTITKTAYTYSVPKAANGRGIADLGMLFPVKFSVQFTDDGGTIREARFQPVLLNEKAQ